MKKIFLLLPVVFLLAGCTYILPKNEEQGENSNNGKESADAKAMADEEEFNDSGQAKAIEDETDLWQIYENEEAWFNLKYPHHVSLDDEEGKIKLAIDVQNINKLEDEAPLGLGKDNALKTREALSNGEYGEVIDFPLEISKQVRAVKGKNAQEFMVLSRFEVCDVVFERKTRFFVDDYQIVLTLSTPKKTIAQTMPAYFTTDNENCEEELIWDFDLQKNFYQNLASGIGSQNALEWFNSFDKIVETIDFTMPGDINQQVFDTEKLLGVWQSLDDEKYSVEFNENKKIDFYDNEENSRQNYIIENEQMVVGEPKIDKLIYEIVKLDDENLEMIYLERGNILRFKKLSVDNE